MSAGIATIWRPGAPGRYHSQKRPRATAAPYWQSRLGPRARWGAPPVAVEGGFGLAVRWKGCRRGGREIKARSVHTLRPSSKNLALGMVSSAACRPAVEADGRDFCNLRRIGAPSLSTSHHRQQSRRGPATGQLPCSSGSAPFRCWMSEHRKSAALTATLLQRGVLCLLRRPAKSLLWRRSAQLQAKRGRHQRSSEALRSRGGGIGSPQAERRSESQLQRNRSAQKRVQVAMARSCGANGLYLVGAVCGALARATYI